MKSKFTPIYIIFFLLIGAIAFLGTTVDDNPENPPNGYTGAPGDLGLCTACHTPGNPNGYNGQVIIEGFPATITPNTTYNMTIRVTNPNGLAFRGGFQAVVLNASNQNAGDLASGGSNPTTQFFNGREYVEHNPALNFPGGNEVTWDFTWTSPAGPGGEVITMYAAGNIASGTNGNQHDLIVTSTATGTIESGSQDLEVEIVSSQNVSCNGGNDGSATAEASGGTPPYSYNWSSGSNQPTANNLIANTYTVTVTDGMNNTTTAMVTITQPPPLVASIISQTNIDCINTIGSATAQGSGGTSPYSYNWSSGGTSPTEFFNNPGNYFVSVTDANLCLEVATVTISENTTPPIATAGPDGVLDCDTPILVLNGAGSSTGPEFTYLWTTFDGNIISGQTTLTPTVNAPGTYTLTVTNQDNGCTASDETMVTEIPDMSLFITGNNVSCFGENDGSINLTVTGGQAPYSYDWNDDSLDGMEDPSGLSAGNYCVTVTDGGGCMETACIDILEPSEIQLSVSTTDESCPGACDGSINMTVSGGTPGYSFSWTGPNGYTANTEDISGLCSGTFIGMVTDSENCTATISVTINTAPPIDISGTVTPASCFDACDGMVELSVSGGTAPYTYVWDDPVNQTTSTATNLCAGDYNVTVTDSNDCTSTASFTVTEPEELMASAETTDASCHEVCDGTVSITASGGTSPYSYDWSGPYSGPDPDDVCAGTHTVTITDANDCSTTVDVTITEPDELVAALSSTNESAPDANDGTATADVSGGTSPYEYLWDDPANQTTPTAVDLAPGTYCVTVTDANDCTTSGCVTVNAGNCDLSATVETQNVLCNGENDGQAEAIPEGGTEPYTYNWSSGGNEAVETGLSAGSHSVTITDANDCEVIVNFTISEPPALELEVTGTDETSVGAMDGTATANISGGTQPYAYLWDDPSNQTTQTIENLPAGTYCVTITDGNDCTISGCVTIMPASCDLEAMLSIQHVSCNSGNDGSATVEATGGTPPYTYDWSSGGDEATETNLSVGAYSVTILDSNGCCIILEFEITEPSPLVVIANASPATCFGECDGSIDLDISGGTGGYAYEWTNGNSSQDIDDLCAGHYTVTVTDANGCTTTIQATVDEPPALELSMSSTAETSAGANDGTATAEPVGGNGGYTYLWDDPLNQTTQTATGLAPGTYCVTVTDDNECTVTGCIVVNPFGCNMSLEISDDNFTCFDTCEGTIDLTVIGGEEPFDFNWSSASIGNVEDPDMLCFGNYSVTVTDANGCSAIISTSVVELPDDIVLSFESVVQSCLGVCDGAIDLTVSGGASPYTYLWSNGETTEDIEELCFDLYEVTVTDANGCTKVGIPTLEEPTGLEMFASGMDISCIGLCDGAIDLTIIGGTQPYDYDWNDDSLDGIEDPADLCAGSYFVTVTDNNGCSVIANINIAEPTPTFIDVTITDASCFEECDGSVDITITGGTPPFVISGETENLCAGIYTVTITDANGCSEVISFEVSEPDELVIAIDEIGHEMNSQSDGFVQVSVTGGTPGFSYNWILDGSTVSTDEDPTGLAVGSYRLEVTDANGCVAVVNEIIVDNITGIVDHDLKNLISLFPNPTNGALYVSFDLNEPENVDMEVFDFTGRMILKLNEWDVLRQTILVDLSRFSEGVYTIKINVDGAFLAERVVKHE